LAADIAIDMIMIFMPGLSARAEYIFSLIFNDLIGVEMVITDQPEEYHSYTGPRLEYSKEPSGDGLFFQAHGLLMETSVERQSVGLFSYNDYTAFFPVYDEG